MSIFKSYPPLKSSSKAILKEDPMGVIQSDKKNNDEEKNTFDPMNYLIRRLKREQSRQLQEKKTVQQNDLQQFKMDGKIRFKRKPSNRSLKKPVQIKMLYNSPYKRNPLVHQPRKKDIQSQNYIEKHIIPPSNLSHNKFQNFQHNPERFFLNLEQGLDNVFKRSKESIIRNAKIIPVKDITDSTNLLDGFVSQ